MKIIKRSLQHRLAIMAMLAIHIFLLGFAAWWMSPTLDEPAHIVAGISHLRFGDFSMYRVNPPLVRMVATIPAILVGYKFEFPDLASVGMLRPEFRFGEEFTLANGRWSLWLTTFGRWSCIPFSLLGAMVCYRWAKDLYCLAAGLLACGLWCFSPMVLGHAALLTPDAPAAALGTLACYTFWHWLREPTWPRAISTGLILGLAELSKTTLILLYPIWPVLWLAYRWRDRSTMPLRQWCDEGAMLTLRMLIGLNVINLGYLGRGSFVQLKEYTFVSELFGSVHGGGGNKHWISSGNRFRQSWLGELPIPLPHDYVLGIDSQQLDFEHFGRPSYLRGQYRQKGWWYYYAYAALIKTPLGTWGLILLAIYSRCTQRIRSPMWRDELILLAPAAIIFIVVSSKTGFSHHYRYVFPCLPLFMIWTSQIAAAWSGFARISGRPNINAGDDQPAEQFTDVAVQDKKSSVGLQLLSVACLAASIASSLYHFPHSLAYFNEAVGGPRYGAEHLINSNIDWGQDLLYLEHWIKNRSNGAPVYLAFDNYLNPFDLEIAQIEPWPFKKLPDNSPIPSEYAIPDGYYAISVNQLYEYPWPLRERDGSRYSIDQRPLKALRGSSPIGWAGYSIRIYSADQLQAAYETVE